jgi:WD40 repeat protein
VYSVAFSPDGQRLVTGGEDRRVRIWSIATGQTLLTLTGHTDVVKSVAFSPGGQQIVSGSDDQTVRFWDSTTGQKLTSLYPNQEGSFVDVHNGYQ